MLCRAHPCQYNVCEMWLGSSSQLALVMEGAALGQLHQELLGKGEPVAGAGSDAWPKPSPSSLPRPSPWRSEEMVDRHKE